MTQLSMPVPSSKKWIKGSWKTMLHWALPYLWLLGGESIEVPGKYGGWIQWNIWQQLQVKEKEQHGWINFKRQCLLKDIKKSNEVYSIFI